MAQRGKPPVKELVADTMALIEPVLTDGLNEEQSSWATELYRDRLLPKRLAGTADASEEVTRLRLQCAASFIRDRLAGLTPEQKLQTLRGLDWVDRLAPLTTEVLSLALARASRPEDAAPASRAGVLLRQLKAVGRQLESEAAEVPPFVLTELSEAILDAAFAAEPGDLTSLRLGRLLRSSKRRREGELDAALDGGDDHA